MQFPPNIHPIVNNHSQRKLPTHSLSFPFPSFSQSVVFSNGTAHTCTGQTHTHSRNTAIIDDASEYKESKASATDEKQDMGFDLSIQLKSGLEKSSQTLKIVPLKESINLNILVNRERHGHEDVCREKSIQSVQEGRARGQCEEGK